MIRDRLSPNHGPRPAGVPIDMLVLHYTGMRSAAEAIDRLRDPAAQVSCHWLVDEDGSVVRMVPEARRAWHAGLSCWRGRRDVNSRSIGIEIVNPGHDWGYRPFPEVQICAVVALAGAILDRHPIPARNVVGHSDIAPMRKIDPGELFPWRRLAAAGIGRMPAPVRRACRPDLGTVRSLLAAYGWPIAPVGGWDAEARAVLAAVQRRYRPHRIDGAPDAGTLQAALGLCVAEGLLRAPQVRAIAGGSRRAASSRSRSRPA